MVNKPTRVYGTPRNSLDDIFMESNIPHFEHGCVSMVFDISVTDHRASLQSTVNSRRTFQTNYKKKSEYHYYKNKLDKLIKQVKHNYYHKEINENKNNAKNLWKVINNICSKENDVISKTIITTNNKVCDTPNRKTYAEKIVKPNTHPPPRSINQYSVFLEPTSEIEINKIISFLKNKKSTGFDNLKTEIKKVENVLRKLNSAYESVIKHTRIVQILQIILVNTFRRLLTILEHPISMMYLSSSSQWSMNPEHSIFIP
nr:unnamed protein product [Callosobruchus analis]